MTEPLLYDFGPSPFCLKVRAILDYKGVSYRRTRIDPMKIARLLRRGATGKVPALELDGALITDSTDVALAIDARWPSPPLLPSNPRERAGCMALEDWSDEALYWYGLYFNWEDPVGRAGTSGAFGRALPMRIAGKVYERMARRQLRGQGLARKSEAHVRRDAERALDTIEGLLGDRDWLLEEGPYLCDFAILAQLAYLSKTPAGGPLVEARPRLVAYRDRLRAAREGGGARSVDATPPPRPESGR